MKRILSPKIGTIVRHTGWNQGENYPCDVYIVKEKYDVLKFDVSGDNLKKINSDLKQFPFTSDYPDYHPHMTIAYLKPGMGKFYVDELKGSDFKNFWLEPSYAVYSEADGAKHKIKLNMRGNVM